MNIGLARTFRLGARFAALFLLLAPEVGAIASTREEVENLAENEGVVVGSVLLTVPPAQQSQGGLSFLAGRKAADFNYSIGAFQAGVIELLARGFRVSATPMKEQFFVEKLPAGSYRLSSFSPTGFVTQMSFPLGFNFSVRPQRVTYIGRLVVTLPDRLNASARIPSDVQDSWPDTLEKLRGDYPSIASASRELAGSVVPGNTMASPRLQQDTLRVLTALDLGNDPTCAQRTVVNTEVLRKASRPDDTAEERWTVDRCGTTVPYLVIYRASEGGGTDVSVKPAQ